VSGQRDVTSALGVRVVTAALVIALSSACSLVAVTGPRTTPGDYLACTTSRAAPIADLVTGSVLVAGGLVVAYWDRHDDTPETGTKTFAITLPAIVVGVAFLAASQYGTSRVSQCRAARAADRRWQPVAGR
jgi:hypothetical protein